MGCGVLYRRFSPASNEVTSNVAKLREYVVMDSTPSPTLQQLVLAEVANNTHTRTDSAYEALQWLGFGMHFLETLFDTVVRSPEPLSKCTEVSGASQVRMCDVCVYVCCCAHGMTPHHTKAPHLLTHNHLALLLLLTCVTHTPTTPLPRAPRNSAHTTRR